jgi:hypothetical protein
MEAVTDYRCNIYFHFMRNLMKIIPKKKWESVSLIVKEALENESLISKAEGHSQFNTCLFSLIPLMSASLSSAFQCFLSDMVSPKPPFHNGFIIFIETLANTVQ